MSKTQESALIRRIRALPIPAADITRAILEFERAERVVDDAAGLAAGLRRVFARAAGFARTQPLRPATR
jgi:hypothetical protein